MFIIAKDKIIGLIVMIVGALIAVVYTLGSIVDLYMQTIGGDKNGIDLTSAIIGIDLLDWR